MEVEQPQAPEAPEVMWMRQCSKHLTHIESRLMESEFLGHEVMRQVGMLIEQFSPPPPPPGGIGGGC